MTEWPDPTQPADRDRWIRAQRGARHAVRADRPGGFFVEQERAESGEVVSTLTVLLTNRECPWRCLMCDLWKNTLEETVPTGAIPMQMDWALHETAQNLAVGRVTPCAPLSNSGHPPHESGAHGVTRPTVIRHLKLYNSGSFFDTRAIPVDDYPAIAECAGRFERVIVECHPVLVNDRVLRFRDLFPGHTQLEVAMGLETAHPEVLAKLNKGMTLDQFAQAARWLRENEIAVRAFVLVKPPFLDEPEALHWAKRSLDFAFDCGADVVSLIPTRFGNGALEALAQEGLFAPPKLGTLEAALDYGVGLQRGRVFADLWDLEKFSECGACFSQRQARLEQINWRQQFHPSISCQSCVS